MVDSVGLVVLTDASLSAALPNKLRKKMKKKVVEWNVADPQGRSIKEIRFIRDQTKARVAELFLA